jgi:hypothetical protein
MHANPKPERRRCDLPVRKRCAKCRCWVLPGCLVQRECPSCTGIQPLPLVDGSGRALRPDTLTSQGPAAGGAR